MKTAADLPEGAEVTYRDSTYAKTRPGRHEPWTCMQVPYTDEQIDRLLADGAFITRVPVGAHTRATLPVGAYVRVTKRGPHAHPPHIGRIAGYDIGKTKYEIGARYGGWGEWLFADGGTWAFPSEVEQITEAEALGR